MGDRLRHAKPVRRLILWAGLCLLAAGPAFGQIFRLAPSVLSPHDFFGSAVAIAGDRALIGASGEHVCGENSGAAYVFEWDAALGTWVETARLTPGRCAPGSHFGWSLSLSGNRALVATAWPPLTKNQPNAVFVFERNEATGAWVETARLIGREGVEEGAFGASVSLDGDRALITTSGDTAGGTYAGAAYLFERDSRTNRWIEAARLTGSAPLHDGVFGGSGALDGDRAVVAASTYFARRPGSVYVFEREAATGRWHEQARFGGIAGFFIPVALNGNRVLVGQSQAGSDGAGAATLYERDAAGTWRHTETLRPHRPYAAGAFGISVSLDGDRALVSGYEEQLGLNFNVDRVVYVFERHPATNVWDQRQIIDIGAWGFGAALSQDGYRALIGQAHDARAGAAYVVRVE